MTNPSSDLRRVSMFDTTLRDGEQAPGNAMGPEQKLKVALALEALGVDVVEAGFPASSPSDFRATRLLTKNLVDSKVCSFARATTEDVDAAVEAGGSGPNHQVQILATASELHLKHKRNIDRAEAVREIRAAVGHGIRCGLTDISVALEDTSRGSDELVEELCDTCARMSVSTVVVCDTSGCHTPDEFGLLVGKVRAWLPDHVRVSIHCHDDMGLAVANAIAGIRAGADQVQTTLAGIGERAGNTATEELVAVIACKAELLGLRTDVRSDQLYSAYRTLRDGIGLAGARNKSIFGENAFATQAGIHQSAIIRNPETYEYLKPENFGRERTLLVGRHSGRAVINKLLGELAVDATPALVNRLYEDLISNRADGECDDLDTLKRRITGYGIAGPVADPPVTLRSS